MSEPSGGQGIAAELAHSVGSADPFAAAVRATPMAMCITDPRLPDNPMVFVNDAFCRLTGYARADIIGRNCRLLQGPATDPAVIAQIRTAVREGQPLKVDLRNYRRDGQAFWNRLQISPVHDPDGGLTYFLASQVDVTAERERFAGLESAQMENEARLRFATQAGRLGIWELELATLELTASAVFKEICGHNGAAPFTYGQLLQAIHADDLARRAAALQHAIDTGDDYDVECRIIRPGGDIAWVQARAQIMRDADGSPIRLAGVLFDTTERRSAELRLELSEQSLRLATEAAEIGTWNLDLTADVLNWSDRSRAIFGIPANEPYSLADFYEGLHPGDREKTRAAFARALDPALREAYEMEYRTIGKTDGAVRWVAAKGRAMFDEAGRCVRATGTVIDISARRAAEARLRASEALLAEGEAKFRAITDSIDQMIWSTRPDGFHDFYNQRWYDYTGVPAGSTDGEAWNGMFHPDDQDRAWARWRHSLATGEHYEIEYRLRHRSGVYRWVLGRAVPQRDCDGVIVRWFGTCTDIQEIVEAREILARSRVELERQVAERTAERDRAWRNSQDLLCVVTPDGVLKAANPAWTTLLGWRPDEVVGRHHLTFNHPDDHTASDAALARAVRDRLPTYESRILHKDGSYRWFAWVASNEGGMAYASGRHITAEKEAAAALERAEEQLRQSQKMEAVGQLTGGIAHDFNNLLTGILGALALMERRIAEGRFNDLQRYATVASTSATRASALTQRLLAFARRQPLDPKPMDANRLVASMEELLRRTLGPSIELEMVLAGGLWPTLCDLNQLENAILNLAINARDAITGSGRLTIETANAHLDEAYAGSQAGIVKPGQYIAISVTDTGSGMDSETAAKAFEPFFTTKPIGQGTGLGLSMLYGFIRQSDGHVRIYSEPGHGTTFRLYLPRHYGPSALADPSSRESTAPEAAPTGKTILVVDDEPAVRMVITEILEEAGYAVIEAVDGASALLALRQDHRIDLLVTDVGLPAGFNGRQLADAARTMRPELRVLFITGFAGNAAIGHGMLDPGMEILTKPFAMEALTTKVRVLIDAAG